MLVGWTSDDKELRAAPIHILSMDDCKQMLKLNATMDAPLCTADSKAATCEVSPSTRSSPCKEAASQRVIL